jgi:hypothetical protein
MTNVPTWFRYKSPQDYERELARSDIHPMLRAQLECEYGLLQQREHDNQLEHQVLPHMDAEERNAVHRKQLQEMRAKGWLQGTVDSYQEVGLNAELAARGRRPDLAPPAPQPSRKVNNLSVDALVRLISDHVVGVVAPIVKHMDGRIETVERELAELKGKTTNPVSRRLGKRADGRLPQH